MSCEFVLWRKFKVRRFKRGLRVWNVPETLVIK